MGLRIVIVVLVFLGVMFGVGLPLADELPTAPGLEASHTAMFLGAVAALPVFIVLVVIPSIRSRPE